MVDTLSTLSLSSWALLRQLSRMAPGFLTPWSPWTFVVLEFVGRGLVRLSNLWWRVADLASNLSSKLVALDEGDTSVTAGTYLLPCW